MLRLASTLMVTCVTLLAQQQSKPVKPAEDMSKMSPEAHAPLFQAPNVVDAGSLTDRVTAGLPAPAGSLRLPPRNFFDEQIRQDAAGGNFTRPLATDQEFLRRVMLDLTGRIPTPVAVRFAHVPDLLLPKLDQTRRTQRNHWVPMRQKFSGGGAGAQMS